MRRSPILYGAALAVLLLLIPFMGNRRVTSTLPSGTLTCLLPAKDTTFQRYLVDVFARDNALEFRFLTADWPLDSLLSGAVDLMIVSNREEQDGISFSPAFTDGTVWAVRSDETEVILRINRWVTELTSSHHFNQMQRHRTGEAADMNAISQYDSLIREAADSIDWDWRLLASIIYHESRFNNDAVSPKGAHGLMQIHSSHYTPQELSNPEVNIFVGSRYLQMLKARYEDAGPVESVKFTLASYNMGDTRVRSLVTRARSRGLDDSRWDEVATLLPRGNHTVSYINKVLDTYACYEQLYPR